MGHLLDILSKAAQSGAKERPDFPPGCKSAGYLCAILAVFTMVGALKVIKDLCPWLLLSQSVIILHALEYSS